MKIRDARTLPSMAQEDLRRKVLRVIRGGKKQVEVAQLFGVTRQAVGKWVKKYREGGLRALRARKRGRPSKSSLLPWQAAQIAKAVVHRYPDQLKLPFYLWTREAVAELIAGSLGFVCRGGRWGAIWRSGVSLLRSPCGEPSSKIRSRCVSGWKRSIRRFEGWPDRRRLRFIGEMRWDFDRTMPVVVRMGVVGRRPSSLGRVNVLGVIWFRRLRTGGACTL